MRKPQKAKEIIPVDIRKIRQTLGLSMKQMGVLIALFAHGLHGEKIPETRINEWEFRYRPVPDYVYTASTEILLDAWSQDRHMTPASRQREVDVYYSAVLNQPLGELFKLELELSRSRKRQLREMVMDVRKVRLVQMRYLETMLQVRMAYVFSAEPGPGDDELDDVA